MNSYKEQKEEVQDNQISQDSLKHHTESVQELILASKKEEHQTKINDIPFDVFQFHIFGHFSTFQLFNMRLVCANWADLIKHIWCIRVKDQMLEQIASLDILYQKETTLKILEYKISHLQQYERMLKSFMNRMNLHAISTHLLSTMDSDAIMIYFLNCVLSELSQGLLVQPTQLTHINIQDAVNYFTSDSVAEDFKKFADLKGKPSLTINQIKMLRVEYYNKFASNQAITGLSGNGPMLARVFVTWIDSAIEYTILKHEVRLIRLQYCNVVKAMNSVSQKWPKKKKFIQGAYKLFLFSKQSHPLTRQVWKLLNRQGVKDYFDFQKCKSKVVEEMREQKLEQEQKQGHTHKQLKYGSEQKKNESKEQDNKASEQQQIAVITIEKGRAFLKMTENLKQIVEYVLSNGDKSEDQKSTVQQIVGSNQSTMPPPQQDKKQIEEEQTQHN